MSNEILRSIIFEMIGNQLDESTEDDLLENIFEEISEGTWEAIEEAILNELSPATLKSYKKKATASRDKNAAKYTMNRDKQAAAKGNSEYWYDKGVKAKYHSTRSAPKNSVYPWDTATGAHARANAEGRKEYEYKYKADAQKKIIDKREAGLSRVNKRLGEQYLGESAIRPYKDWNSLYDEAKRDGEDIAQFILDNTDDDKAQMRGGQFNPAYVRAVTAWVKAKG